MAWSTVTLAIGLDGGAALISMPRRRSFRRDEALACAASGIWTYINRLVGLHGMLHGGQVRVCGRAWGWLDRQRLLSQRWPAQIASVICREGKSATLDTVESSRRI